MSRLIISALAVSLLGPAAAFAQEQQQFTRDGVSYSFTVSEVAGGQLIKGKSSGSKRFRLLVRNGRVSGHVDNQPVSFRAPAGYAAPAALQVASR